MNSILRRRRALMAQDGKIIWKWTPSDGLRKLSITSNSGSPSYSLLSDSLKINLPADVNKTIYVSNTSSFSVPLKYCVSCYYKNIPSAAQEAGIQLAITSRFDNGVNARAIIQIYTSTVAKRISACGTLFNMESIPSEGKLSMLYDKTNGTVSVYLDNTFVGSVSYTPTTSTPCIIWMNSTVETSINIKAIVIEEAS